VAYSTGAATDIPDLMSKIETFISANGWTIDEADSFQGQPAWHKNSCYVSFRYDGSSPSAFGRSMGVYQATGYSGTGTRPGGHTGDSGCGYWVASVPADSTIDTYRCVYQMGDGPFTYWLFEYDDGTVYYINIVLEVRQGEYRHIGFGMLEKFGDWGGHAGGEYLYGCRNESGYNSGDSCFGLDSGNTGSSTEGTDSAASIRVGGSYPGKELSDWATVTSSKTLYTNSKDRANVQRSGVLGGVRKGAFPAVYGQFTGYPGFTGVIPMTAIELFMIDYTNGRTRFLGAQKDIRFLSIANFSAAEEVVIGSDTWVMFPILKKGTLMAADAQGDSGYAGFAYRKDLT